MTVFDNEKKNLRARFGQDWEKMLRERIAANIWRTMKENKISSLDLRNSLVGIPPVWFTETELLHIIRGEELVKTGEELDIIAMYLNTDMSKLVQQASPAYVERPPAATPWHDSAAASRAENFVKNARRLAETQKVDFHSLVDRMPKIEQMENGTVPLTEQDLQKACAFLKVQGNPAMLSMENGKAPNGYPQTAIGSNGAVSKNIFGKNLYSSMQVRLITVPELAKRTGKDPIEILEYMSGRKAPASDVELVDFAQKAGIPEFFLSGMFRSRTPSAKPTAPVQQVQSQPALQKTPVKKVEPEQMPKPVPTSTPIRKELPKTKVLTPVEQQGALVVANLRKVIRMYERDPQTIQLNWNGARMKVRLADVWSGKAIAPGQDGAAETVCEVLKHYSKPQNTIKSENVLGSCETEKKRKTIIDMSKAIKDERTLALILALAEECAAN